MSFKQTFLHIHFISVLNLFIVLLPTFNTNFLVLLLRIFIVNFMIFKFKCNIFDLLRSTENAKIGPNS